MSTNPPSQSGVTPSLYADCIYNTSLLPASINSGANPKLSGISASVNGISYGFADPESEATFIANLNLAMSITFYGTASGFLVTGPSKSVAGACRYVVMHSNAQNPSQAAHQLLVAADGTYTFITTNWTS
jgi:hypothetical protein